MARTPEEQRRKGLKRAMDVIKMYSGTFCEAFQTLFMVSMADIANLLYLTVIFYTFSALSLLCVQPMMQLAY